MMTEERWPPRFLAMISSPRRFSFRKELQNGNTVEMKGLGSFSLSVKYKHQQREEIPRFNRRNIQDVKVVFRPAKEMKINVSNLKMTER